MCVIIDTNTLSRVFRRDNQMHNEFKPMFDWIYNGNGKIVYGGDKYIKELSKTRYIRLFKLFKDAAKIVEADRDKVDNKVKEIEQSFKHRDFNDSHLVAIVIVSHCNLICSDDKTSYKFLRKREFYPNNIKRPKIYRGLQSRDLLVNKNCKPCDKKIKMRISVPSNMQNIQQRIDNFLNNN